MSPISKACDLKGNQKVFYLQIGRVASCERAESEVIDDVGNIESYVNQWQQESYQLTQGVELPGCKHCWREEQQGRISYRQKSLGSNHNTIELYISNLCNHMCSYCSPKYSSLWQESVQTQGIFQNISQSARQNLTPVPEPTNTDHWLQQIQDYIQTCQDRSVNLKLLGGEPLMQQRNLEKLLQMNCNKIKTLEINTNLNPPNNKFLLWLLDQIDPDQFSITISLDATPAWNHVPRAGFDRDRFESNLSLLQRHGIQFSINSTVSVLSLFDLTNFIAWRDKHGFDVSFFKIQNPDCLDPLHVPYQFRQRIWQQIKHLNVDPIIAEILQHQNKSVDLKLFEQYNYMSQYFSRASIDPKHLSNDLFVEYWSWLVDHVDRKLSINENSPSV
jgi:organic radical activating enzyme